MNTVRKYMLNIFMEIKFGTQKYSKVFIVSTGYIRLTKFIGYMSLFLQNDTTPVLLTMSFM